MGGRAYSIRMPGAGQRRLRRWAAAVVLGSLLGACQPQPEPPVASAPDWWVVPGVRVGPVDSTTSEQDLIARVGEGHIVRRHAQIGEGFCAPGSVIDPDTPDSVVVVWTDSTFTRPAIVFVSGEGSRWKTAAGVRVGTTLRELEALSSGKPIRFMGFGWDYGGSGSWSEPGSGELRIVLHPDSASNAAANSDPRAGEIMGDREVSSDHPLLRQMTIRVVRMSIQWSEPRVQYTCPGL